MYVAAAGRFLVGVGSRFKNEWSPEVLLRKRYQLFDPIMEETRFVFGLDKKGRDVTRIMLLVYDSEEEFE